MDNNEQNSKHLAVGQTIDNLMAKSFDSPTSEVVNNFNLLEESLLSNEADAGVILAIKRRVAESVISIIFKNPDAKELFNAAWDNIQKLEYSTKEREASMLFYRAQFLIRNKYDKSSVMNAIERLGAIANDFENEKSEHLAEHFKKVHKNLIMEVDSRYS